MAPVPAVTILHLSDLHFGRKHRFEQDGFGALLSRVTLDLAERAAKDGLSPELVVLSGDFAEYGKRDEFDRAATFVRGLRAHLQLPARRFVMVPGNHDVNWNKSRAYFEDRAGDGLPAEEPYFGKFAHYKRFFDAFYEGEDGIGFTEEEPWSLFEMPDLGVVVAGMDSAFAESHRDEDHHGFLGERQIRAFAGRLRAFKERGYLRIGVLHHDPFDKRGAAKADQDQRDFRRWLVPELNLVLHGDIHEETSRHLDRDVPALGVGSAAVGVEDRGPDVSNEYQILVVRADGVERHLRAWVSDQKRWVASPRADAGGESGRSFVRADFQAVTALGDGKAPPPAVDLTTIVERYRSAIVRRQGAPTVFDLLGVGESEESGGLDFLRLFVPQDAVRDVRRVERVEQARRMADLDLGEAAGDARSGAVPESWTWMERPRTVEELFDHRRLLLVGAPGAGKSALTRWLLLKLCVPGERIAGLPDGLVPVRVELRSFDQEHRGVGNGYTVFDHVAREQADFHGPIAADHLRDLAGQGRVLWLFDGLDEIAEPARRGEMAQRIAGLLDRYGECRCVVTSRVAGVDVARPVLEGAMFQTYALQDFTPEQRDRFLDAWHALVFRRDPAAGAQRRNRMGAAIEEAASLKELCKSPLLCAMLAYLHREEALPRRRHLLYQKVLERMAQHWDANKGLPVRPVAERFELEDKLAFLRALAWQMQSEPRTAGNAIGRGELEDVATGFCESRWGQPKDAARRRAEALIEQLHARNGVLSYLGGNAFGFAHRAFLEYLAASEAVERFRTHFWGEEELGGVFAARWQDPTWEETLLLTCGLLQEDGETGCSRVVRLLQRTSGGSAANVYSQLEKYLAFCVKALGELPQLERGAPGDFARAINDVLAACMNTFPFGIFWMVPAFRRCSGRWPDVRKLVEEAAREPKIAHNWGFPNLFIAAGGPLLRRDILLLAARWTASIEGSGEALHWSLCNEASRQGPWAKEESSSILTELRDQSEAIRASVAAAIVSTAGSCQSEADLPVQVLSDIAFHTKLTSTGLACAWTLARTGFHTEAARKVLLEAASSGGEHEGQAVEYLAQEGLSCLVLTEIERLAPQYGRVLLHLARLAEQEQPAAPALRRAVASLRATGDPGAFLEVTAEVWSSGYRLFSDDEILVQWRQLADPERKSFIALAFLQTPGAQPLLARAWLEMLDQDLRNAILISRLCLLPTPQEVGPRLLDVWARLLDSGVTEAVLSVANRILELGIGGHLGLRAAKIRDEALLGGSPEDVRLWAARRFRTSHAPTEDVLADLAQHAKDDKVRQEAAGLTGNLASLNELARSTMAEDLKKEIRSTLDLYGEINALLQVGKLRRARVRFDGRDAGILEELTKVGNGTRFRYDDAYDGPPIGPHMPLGRTYENTESLLPFFANLLPEGILYEQTARKLGVKRSDRLGVLLHVGADTMGAVEVLPMESA